MGSTTMQMLLRRATRTLAGVGLHSGQPCSVRVEPHAEPGVVIRTSATSPQVTTPRPHQLAATLEAVDPLAARRIGLADTTARVETVEHLLAALAGCGIYRAAVIVGGPEVPALDGSARPFVEALRAAGLTPAPADPGRPRWTVLRPFEQHDGLQRCSLAPPTAPARLCVDCAIDFAHLAIGQQRFELTLDHDDVPPTATFTDEVAPARTFGLLREAEQLRAAGLARGASLESALVFDDREALNPGGLRFADEPVRHKVLDVLGGLSLLGAPLCAQLRLQRASHRLLIVTLRAAIAAGALRRTNDPIS